MRREALRLWAKQFRADPWVVLALAVLILAASFVMAAVPRLMSVTADRQLAEAVTSLSAYQRDPAATWTLPQPETQFARDTGYPWPAIIDGAEQLRQDQHPALRRVLQEPQVIATVGPAVVTPAPEDTRFYETRVQPMLSPRITEVMDLVEGQWPEATYELPHTVVFDAEVAAEVGYGVGDVIGETLEIVGLVRPKDPADPRWDFYDPGAAVGLDSNPNRGVAALVSAYLAPDHVGSLVDYSVTQVRYQLWYPVSTQGIAGGTDVVQLQAELTNLLARNVTLIPGDEAQFRAALDVRFESQLGTTLERVTDQQRATVALVAVVAAGPVGVAAAVTVLGAQLAVLRRRRSLGLAIARGASPEQLRWLIGIEATMFAVPAALIGHLLAAWLVPGVSPWWQPVITVLLAAAVPAALIAAIRRPDDRSRHDLSSNGTRRRWAAEIAVVALTAAATFQLLRRDAENSASLDVLGAATPILLALSTCVIVMRLYPIPLAALSRVLRRGRGLTAHLGSARALRDPAGGLVPALAVVLGATVAVLSTVLLSTVTRGTETAIWTENGAALRISGPSLSDETMAEIRAIDGVSAAGRLTEAGSNRELHSDGVVTGVQVWVAEDELAEVWATSDIVSPPGAFFREGTVTLVTGGTTPELTGQVDLGILGRAQVVGHIESLPGSPATRGNWVLTTESDWRAAGGPLPSSNIGLIRIDAGADQEAVEAALVEVTGSGMITDVQSRLSAHLDSTVVQWLTAVFVAAAVLTSLLTVLALVVVQIMGGPSRAELLAVLRTLGASPREVRGIVAWELGPVVVTSLLVGSGLGVAISRLLVESLDLSSLTGGAVAPQLFLDPVLLLIVLASVVLTAALAVLLSAWLAGRTNLAQALRIGEQR